MKIGLLYDANNYTYNGNETDYSLLSEITKISNGFKELNYDIDLINGLEELVFKITKYSNINGAPWDIVMYHISWTRTLQKESVTAFLEFYKIPYIGNSQKALTLCADKYCSKLFAKELGIPVPKYIYQEFPYSYIMDYTHIISELGSPFIIKANGTSGSIGVKKIDNYSEYQKAWKEFSEKWHDGILLEEYIVGTDLTVPVLRNNRRPFALGVVQYKTSNNDSIPFFTRNIKYFEEISCINYENNKICNQVKKYSLKMHKATHCSVYSRCDFRITDNGEVYFLECNATPDLNPHGAFVVAGGMDFANLLQHITMESQK